MRLVDGTNLTSDASHMWTAEFKQHNTIVLTIKFEDEIFVTGMRVWNYNASLGLSYSGVGFYSYKILIEEVVMLKQLHTYF